MAIRTRPPSTAIRYTSQIDGVDADLWIDDLAQRLADGGFSRHGVHHR